MGLDSNRVKEYRFPAQTFSANGDDATVYTSHPIVGEILDVQWSFNRTGSVSLLFSGTSLEVFRRNAPSGTGWQQAKPRVFGQITTGSIANANMQTFVANEPIVLSVLNAASGTQTLDVVVRYR